jgi:hypothetical protein
MRIFLDFLVFLASALRDKGVFTFSYVKFYSQTTSRASKIMPCKMKKNSTIKSEMAVVRSQN